MASSAPEVRARLLAVRDPQSRWWVRDGAPEQVDVVGEWHHRTVWERREFRILLRLDETRHEVRALDAQWIHDRNGSRYEEGNLTQRSWDWTLGAGGEEQAVSRFDSRALKDPLRATVTDAGWTWTGLVTHRGLATADRPAPRVGGLQGRARRGYIVAATAVSLLAVLLLGIAVLLAATAGRSAGDARAGGRVVAVETQHGGDLTRPVIEFTPPGGAPVRTAGDTWSRPPQYAVGDPVPVRYHSDDPQDATPDDFWSLDLGAVVCGGIGLVFAVPAAILVVVGLPGRRRPRDGGGVP